jgi:aspartyl-tRNA(Asn)/glutamyl-tRNA(Gln) amidotransferase subunit B
VKLTLQNKDKYEAVIGLEVHAQLLTNSKAFSSDAVEFGAEPNTDISVITLGYPGTLPKLNKEVVELAVKMGLACNCQITKFNKFARKNYFYADLPKGYQISQHNTPLCTHGFINITTDGLKKRIGITRIHLEEDSGKSIHDQDPYYTLIDLNRAGTGLIEIVSEPEMRSSDEAYEYLTEIRKIVRWLDICDGNMEEGSLRCDANVSVMLRGEKKFGSKVEVKNMNSIRNVKRALEHEIERQIETIEKGGKIYQETRTFDAGTGKTSVMRTKEMADDYRYFTEPDLPPVVLTDDYIESIKKGMPALPEEMKQNFITEFSLTEYDASQLTEDKDIASYFLQLVDETKNYKAAANWIMGPIKTYLNNSASDIRHFSIKPDLIAEVIALIDANKINFSSASQVVFPELLQHPSKSVETLAKELNVIQESDAGALNEFIKQAIAKYPEKVVEYKNGKQGLIGLFMGEVMKLSKGKADPKLATKLLKEKLDN